MTMLPSTLGSYIPSSAWMGCLTSPTANRANVYSCTSCSLSLYRRNGRRTTMLPSTRGPYIPSSAWMSLFPSLSARSADVCSYMFCSLSPYRRNGRRVIVAPCTLERSKRSSGRKRCFPMPRSRSAGARSHRPYILAQYWYVLPFEYNCSLYWYNNGYALTPR